MTSKLRISPITSGHDMRIGVDFQAKHFREDSFHGLIDPIVMLDHFHMTAPTFDPHPHAGISAVTYMFEDATSAHVNYDSLGNHGPIHPGDLHWLVAGRGAMHTEQPEGDNPHVHALQIFVNLPASKKMIAPYAVHVNTADIPEFHVQGIRVRVVIGESKGICSPAQLPEPFTLLDGFLDTGATYEHILPTDWNAMVYIVQGTVKLYTNIVIEAMTLQQAQAVGIASATTLRLTAIDKAHFIVLSGLPLNEPLVKQGPFVMNTLVQMNERVQAYQRGEFGQLTLP